MLARFKKIRDRGELNRFLTLEERTLSENEIKESVETWSLLKSTWGSVEYDNIYETQSSGKEINKRVLKIVLSYETVKDYLPGIAKTLRVNYDATIYDIIEFAEIGRRDYIGLICVHAS